MVPSRAGASAASQVAARNSLAGAGASATVVTLGARVAPGVAGGTESRLLSL
jgi:hypothetical protein